MDGWLVKRDEDFGRVIQHSLLNLSLSLPPSSLLSPHLLLHFSIQHTHLLGHMYQQYVLQNQARIRDCQRVY